MIVVIDNYDSFTYNLVQYLGELGAELIVFRNDQVTLEEIERLAPSHIVISPGPGTPEEGGISNALIERFHRTTPILGVCLGHQCIGYIFGGRVGQAPRLMHGKVSAIYHDGRGIFNGLPNPFSATRYHSLIVEEPLPDELEASAYTDQGEVMALRHRRYPTVGVQFHPESILTEHGKRLLKNFLNLTNLRAQEGIVRVATHISTGGRTMDIREAIAKVVEGQDLTEVEAEATMGQIMDGQATPAQIGAFLAALRMKGETMTEITGCARAMRDKAIPVRPKRTDLVDTCGTGGDKAGTFNISTTVAFVVAGAGLGVAKHGNRSVSSRCGSADLLKEFGVNLELTPQQVADCIDKVGIGFLFAPKLHPAMKHAIGPRREMGIRTIFNILGPLTNPALAPAQVMGVYDGALTEPLAGVLRALGSRAAFVVHGADGLDELSTTGVNKVSRFDNSQISTFALDPLELGLPRASLSDLRGGTPEDNVAITTAILRGERGPKRDVVLLNAAAALVAGGKTDDLKEGLALAAEAIDSGQAMKKLERLVDFSQDVADDSG